MRDEAGRRSSRPRAANPLSAAETPSYLPQDVAGLMFPADARKDFAGLAGVATLGQPTGTFRDEPGAQKVNHRRRGNGSEHPSPPQLAIPGQTDSLCRRTVRNSLCDRPVDDLCGKNADDYRELVQRDQAPAPLGGADLSDIHRGQVDRKSVV